MGVVNETEKLPLRGSIQPLERRTHAVSEPSGRVSSNGTDMSMNIEVLLPSTGVASSESERDPLIQPPVFLWYQSRSNVHVACTSACKRW